MESVENQLKGVVGRIRAIRMRKSMSQLELSLQANLSQSFLACVESGKKQPSVLTLLRIANALKVNPSLFFLEDENALRDIANIMRGDENVSREEKEKIKNRIIQLVRTL